MSNLTKALDNLPIHTEDIPSGTIFAAAGLVVLLKEDCQTPGCDDGQIQLVSLHAENTDLDLGTRPDPHCLGRGWVPTAQAIEAAVLAIANVHPAVENYDDYVVDAVLVAVLSMGDTK